MRCWSAPANRSLREKAVCNDEASAGPQQTMRLRQQRALVRAVRMATALQRVYAVIAGAWQNGVFVVALDDAHTLAAAGCFVERTCVLHLPRHSRQSQQARVRQAARKAAQRGAEAAAKVEQPRLRDAIHLQPRKHLGIHLLQHGFAVQRICARAVVAEVHVELAAPRGVIRTRLAVVLLQADLRRNMRSQRLAELRLLRSY